ncbi:MAG: anti-sigma F factor [Clostridia bacterium]|nr:anti-sigma F factor [Clostridia bacterium]MBR6109062.1 anti-sigma F factor [Clostridia bacterium]
MKNYLYASFPSLTCNESLARGVCAQFAIMLDPTVEELSDVRTAVSEAVTNAIIHGYGNADGQVVMELEAEDDMLTVTVRDTGRGIEDIELARRPFYTSKPGEERSGMGFAVMEAFMDSVEVESAPGRGTTVIMRKRFLRDG